MLQPHSHCIIRNPIADKGVLSLAKYQNSMDIIFKATINRESLVIILKSVSWAGHVARMEEGRRAFKILTGKPTGKRPLGRPRRRWEDNIRMDLKEIGINRSNWINSAQDRDY